MRVVLAALLVAALAAGCDDTSQKYSRSDVNRAFRSQGFELVAPNRGDDVFTIVLDPKTGDEFFIAVYENEEHAKKAKDAYLALGSQASTAATTTNLRKGNVVVTTDEGVTARVQTRIRAALARLS